VLGHAYEPIVHLLATLQDSDEASARGWLAATLDRWQREGILEQEVTHGQP